MPSFLTILRNYMHIEQASSVKVLVTQLDGQFKPGPLAPSFICCL